MNRRDLVKRTGLGLMATAMTGWQAIGQHALAAATSDQAAGKRLIVVFLRGAVDGLSVVVPHADEAYYRHRSSIALPRPGAPDGAHDLDGHFGLHPALSALMPLWQAKQLAFVHASGSTDTTRSHFDAQDYMESGTPGRKATPSGWMNRLLDVLAPGPSGQSASATQSAMQAISMGPSLPRIFSGPHSVTNLPTGKAITRPSALDKQGVAKAFAGLYDGDDKLSQAYRQSRDAHQAVMADMAGDDAEMSAANNGAPLPNGFADDAARVGTLFRKDKRIQLGFMALGGWDTHANQGAATGQLASRLTPLGQGLAALAQQMGPVWQDTVVVVMSEFGRTVKQNGNGGTDHGHANVMWLLGGKVSGGRVAGTWPGLDESALYEGRDLAVTTDFRAVLASVMTQHLGLNAAQLQTVFPAFTANAPGLSLIRT